MVSSVCQAAGRRSVAGQCSGWDESLVSCCRPTNSACLVTPWSAWSACPRLCLGGTQTRKRDIVAPASGTFAACPSASDPELLQSQRCDVCDSCIMSAYTNWSACSKSCGGGERSRTRSVTQPATCDCTPCSSTLRETQSCNSQACPVDCVLSPYSAYSECNAPCGGGQKLRQRTIVTQPSNGGRPCDSLLEQAECNTQPCQCTLSDWNQWAMCSVTCGGGGTQRRTRTILTNPSNCGAALTEDRECGLTVCPTPAPAPPKPTTVGTMRADGSILVDFCDPATVAITVASDATANLVGGVNVDFAPQDSGDALERKSCSLQTRNGAGGALTLVFSKPMVLISLKLFAFDAGDVGELLFDDGLKRSPRVVPLKGRDNALEMSTFRGHQSYAVVMLGTTQFGIEALVVREPNGVTFLAPTPATAAPGGLDEVGSGTAVGINTGEVPAMSGGGEDDLLPLWIVLGVLACLVVTLLVAFFIVSKRKKNASATISVDNAIGGGVGTGYGHNVGNSSAYPSHMDNTADAPGYPTQQMYGHTMTAANASGTTFNDAPTLDQMPPYATLQKSTSHYGSTNKFPTAARDF